MISHLRRFKWKLGVFEMKLLIVLSVMTIIGAFSVWLGLSIAFIPHKLSKKQRMMISKLGLIHFTTEEAAEKIINSSVINKSTGFLELKSVFFFQNAAVAINDVLNNCLENKKVGIEILNLTEQQLKHLRIRYRDGAIIYHDDFLFSDTNRVSVKSKPDILPAVTNSTYCFIIATILMFTGVFIVFLSAFMVSTTTLV